jgi:hypothetical protein
MGLMEILDRYTGGANEADPRTAPAHFDEVVAQAPRDVIGKGLGDAFRADSTPPFGDMVGHMFGQSDPQQRAGLLNNLLHSLGPAVASVLGGSALGRSLGQSNGSGPRITPEQASKLSPEEVRDIANRAEQHDPGILDKVGDFYAEHPQLVKTLGSAALAIALAGVSNRMRGRN